MDGPADLPPSDMPAREMEMSPSSSTPAWLLETGARSRAVRDPSRRQRVSVRASHTHARTHILKPPLLTSSASATVGRLSVRGLLCFLRLSITPPLTLRRRSCANAGDDGSDICLVARPRVGDGARHTRAGSPRRKAQPSVPVHAQRPQLTGDRAIATGDQERARARGRAHETASLKREMGARERSRRSEAARRRRAKRSAARQHRRVSSSAAQKF